MTLEHKLERDAEINPEGKMGVEHRRDGSKKKSRRSCKQSFEVPKMGAKVEVLENPQEADSWSGEGGRLWKNRAEGKRSLFFEQSGESLWTWNREAARFGVGFMGFFSVILRIGSKMYGWKLEIRHHEILQLFLPEGQWLGPWWEHGIEHRFRFQ